MRPGPSQVDPQMNRGPATLPELASAFDQANQFSSVFPGSPRPF